jgi:ferric-dicitrate binding protein FerR (iron transport regulator)
LVKSKVDGITAQYEVPATVANIHTNPVSFAIRLRVAFSATARDVNLLEGHAHFKAVKVESVTAWQRETLVLDDIPVPDALAAMNRCFWALR